MTLEIILLITAVLLIVTVGLIIYFSRKKTSPAIDEKSAAQETPESEPEPIEDPYAEFMPHVSEVENEENVKSGYRKIEVPAILKSDILKTLSAGAMVIWDRNTYKVEFSPEVVSGLKNKSMTLMERVDGKGFLPAVKKEGAKGIYQQAVLVKHVNPALVVQASANLLTAVVGQQQLMEIQSSLKNMGEKLDTIIQHRDNDFFGRTESRFIYFSEIIGRFRSNGIMLGVTVLFVTHDRDEAFELSDRIGIMSDGRLLQVGTGKELYDKPISTEIAAFLGIKNIIRGSITDGRFVSEDQTIIVNADKADHEGQSFLILRPEVLQVAGENTRAPIDAIRVAGRVRKLKFSQGFYTVFIEAGDQELECLLFRGQSEELEVGQTVELFFNQSDAWFVGE